MGRDTPDETAYGSKYSTAHEQTDGHAYYQESAVPGGLLRFENETVGRPDVRRVVDQSSRFRLVAFALPGSERCECGCANGRELIDKVGSRDAVGCINPECENYVENNIMAEVCDDV